MGKKKIYYTFNLIVYIILIVISFNIFHKIDDKYEIARDNYYNYNGSNEETTRLRESMESEKINKDYYELNVFILFLIVLLTTQVIFDLIKIKLKIYKVSKKVEIFNIITHSIAFGILIISLSFISVFFTKEVISKYSNTINWIHNTYIIIAMFVILYIDARLKDRHKRINNDESECK